MAGIPEVASRKMVIEINQVAMLSLRWKGLICIVKIGVSALVEGFLRPSEVNQMGRIQDTSCCPAACNKNNHSFYVVVIFR